MKKTLFVCGGSSVESEISCLTALKICKVLKSNDTPFLLVYLDEDHHFNLVNKLEGSFVKNKNYKEGFFVRKKNKWFFKVGLKKYTFDQVVILGHGKNIEEGSVACYFKTLGIKVLSESIYNGTLIQDKVKFKMLLKSLKINSLPFSYLYKYQIEDDELIKKITMKLNYPLIVKPNCLGSSIGINKVNNYQELKRSLYEAFMYDQCVIIEEYLELKKEINVALMGYKDDYKFSSFEEVNSSNKVLSFYDKYDYSKENEKRIINPTLSDDVKNKIYKDLKKLHSCLNLCGVIRFDYFISNDNKIYLNEANLIPGSLGYYLFDSDNLSKHIEDYLHILEKREKDESLLLTKFKEGFMSKIDIDSLKK